MLFKNKTYKRFENIYKILGEKNHIFNTKLGKRNIIITRTQKDKSFYLTYFDCDKSILFMIHVLKNGNVNKVTSKINDFELFLAIYEIEKIIFKKIKNNIPTLTSLYRWY